MLEEKGESKKGGKIGWAGAPERPNSARARQANNGRQKKKKSRPGFSCLSLWKQVSALKAYIEEEEEEEKSTTHTFLFIRIR